jgi:hypothetical protein
MLVCHLLFFVVCDIVECVTEFLILLLWLSTSSAKNLQAGELAENVAKMINPQFADKVDMSEVQVTNHYLLFFPLVVMLFWSCRKGLNTSPLAG